MLLGGDDYIITPCIYISKVDYQRGILMITDTEIKIKGTQILAKSLGDIEMEKFIALIQREPFDYTEWRKDIDKGLSLKEISHSAMLFRQRSQA